MNEKLPVCFQRPKTDCVQQISLFQINLNDVLVRLRISHDDFIRWKSNGWLSFDAVPNLQFNEYDDLRINELVFVRDIVRSGLSDAQINYVLSLLPKPYSYNPERIVFSFHYGWVEPVPIPSSDSIFDDCLDDWLENLDIEQLWDIQKRVRDLIATYKKDVDGDKSETQ